MLRFLFLFVLLWPLGVHAQVELIVRVTPGSPAANELTARVATAAPGIEAVQPVRLQTATDVPAYVLSFPDSAAYRSALATWAVRGGVAYVQPNQWYTLDTFAAPGSEADSLYHLDLIGARKAWPVTRGAAEVTVGVVDTGIDLDHPDLAGQLWRNPAEVVNGQDDDGNGYIDDVVGFDFVDRPFQLTPGDVRERDADPQDDPSPGGGRGHGTSVAGVIAAEAGGMVTGVAPGIRLVPLRAFGPDGRGQDDDIAAAIFYAADLGVDVLNLSFGDAYISSLMREAIRYATSRGTLVVASAGNAGGTKPHYPSDYPDVLAVGWTDQTGTQRAGFAQHGIGLDLVAPGTNIMTTLLPDASDDPILYGRRSGSSMAAPMASAAAALLRSVDADLSPSALRAILTTNAEDLAPAGWDDETAAGLLRIDRALAAAYPAEIRLHLAHESGIPGGDVDVVATVLSPLLEEGMVSLVHIETGEETPLGPAIVRQQRAALVARWATEAWADGAYEIRLSVRLRNGQTIEDRRRVFLDRTAPDVDVLWLGRALRDGRWGVFAEVQTDDLSTASLAVSADTVVSDRVARRHGLWWPAQGIDGAQVTATVTVTNVAGLSQPTTRTITLPPLRLRSSEFEAEPLDVPAGYLLPHATDFDEDGLQEIVFNRYEDGWLGDTLAVYEWTGEGFTPAQRLLANVFPRDTGDTDGDGRVELLTQVSSAALLIEHVPGEGLVDVAFLDSTALGDPTSDAAVFAARLTDLDGDGLGEILAHNTRAWKLLEWNGSGYTEVAQLENPTPSDPSELGENILQEPKALVGDFDADGHTDVLTGDADGDLVMYEAKGNNQYAVVWTATSDRYDAGSRFATGDFDGDGRTSFWTYTQNWTGLRGDHEYEQPTGLLRHWEATGDDTYLVIDSVLVASNASRHGALAALDVDGDGRDELALAHPPGLWILDVQGGHAHPRYHTALDNAADAVRSIVLTPADFDNDGADDLVFATSDGDMHLLRPTGIPSVRAPIWASARFPSRRSVALSWRAAGADSVSVYRMTPSAEYMGGGVDSTLVVPHGTMAQTYRAVAWAAGVPSPLTKAMVVSGVPAEAVQLVSATWKEGWLKLVFDQPVNPLLEEKYILSNGRVADKVVIDARAGIVRAQFGALPAGAYRAALAPVQDAYGLPVAQETASFEVGAVSAEPLTLVSWRVMGPREAELTFDVALDAATLHPGAFEVRPTGRVVAAVVVEGTPEAVRLTLDAPALGATGQATTVIARGVRGVGGEAPGVAGHVATLSGFAEDLDGVYLFPNPLHTSVTSDVTIAGLPRRAEVSILTLDGTLVAMLEETDGDGGLRWDARDSDGRAVPSGVYLIRVTAEGQRPVLRKLALYR